MTCIGFETVQSQNRLREVCKMSGPPENQVFKE